MAARASLQAALECGAAVLPPAPPPAAYLNVVVPYFNALRVRRRPQLHAEMMRRLAPLEASGRVRVLVAEAALPGQAFEVTAAACPSHLQLRWERAFFAKEALVNAAVARLLPHDTAPIAWLDGDLVFVSDTWADDALAALAVHPVVQLFESAHDLGARGELHGSPSVSLGWAHQAWLREHAFDGAAAGAAAGAPSRAPDYLRHAHPGFAWAATRAAWDALGGLFALAVCGGGDRIVGAALLGYADAALPAGASPRYRAALAAWAAGAAALGRNIGFVRGTILHGYHGSRGKRAYKARHGIVAATGYDPLRDTRLVDGMLQLAPGAQELGVRILSYLGGRDEDMKPSRDDALPAGAGVGAGAGRKRPRPTPSPTTS
jgi:hypothetical protein